MNISGLSGDQHSRHLRWRQETIIWSTPDSWQAIVKKHLVARHTKLVRTHQMSQAIELEKPRAVLVTQLDWSPHRHHKCHCPPPRHILAKDKASAPWRDHLCQKGQRHEKYHGPIWARGQIPSCLGLGLTLQRESGTSNASENSMSWESDLSGW